MTVHWTDVPRAPGGKIAKGTHWRQPKPHWQKGWWEKEYVEKKRSAADIAEEIGCIDENVYFWLRKVRHQAANDF